MMGNLLNIRYVVLIFTLEIIKEQEIENTFLIDQQSLILSRQSLKNKHYIIEPNPPNPTMNNIPDQNYNVNLNIPSINNSNENIIQNGNKMNNEINLKDELNKSNHQLEDDKNTSESRSGRSNDKEKMNHRI